MQAKGILLLIAAIMLLDILVLTSCAPYIDLKKGVVSTGFLSTVQGFSGKIKLADGSTAVFSVVGSDAATGPTNLAGSIGGSIVGVKGFQSADTINASNNQVKNVAAQQVTAQQAATLNAQTAQAQINATAAKVAGQQANAAQLSTILKKGPPAPK